MKKQTKTILMVGGAAVLAYVIYKSMKPKPTTNAFANAVGSKKAGVPKEIEICQRECKNSSNQPECMGKCLDRLLNANTSRRK